MSTLETSNLEANSQDRLYSERQERLLRILEASGFQAGVLNPGPTLTYLTGLNFHLMERPVVLIMSSRTTPVLVLPELELPKLDGLPYPILACPYPENPAVWLDAFQRGLLLAEVESTHIGVEPGRLRFLELQYLQKAAPMATFSAADGPLADLRMHKDEGELARMRKAVEIAQQALLETIPQIKMGITERELAAELSLQLLRHGSDAEMPFSPIVSAGPNSANPHASPTSRRLRSGDLLVIDWGAAYQGYISDLTRTFAIGEPEPEMALIARVVEQANAGGRAAARPGVAAGTVDQATRQVIEDAGYGQFFTHRTGHGIGMEGHEPPYIRGDNTQVLSPGMTFTVEPGIYLPGRGGVRIEDDMLVTPSSAVSLSDLPRALQVIDG